MNKINMKTNYSIVRTFFLLRSTDFNYDLSDDFTFFFSQKLFIYSAEVMCCFTLFWISLGSLKLLTNGFINFLYETSRTCFIGNYRITDASTSNVWGTSIIFSVTLLEVGHIRYLVIIKVHVRLVLDQSWLCWFYLWDGLQINDCPCVFWMSVCEANFLETFSISVTKFFLIFRRRTTVRYFLSVFY